MYAKLRLLSDRQVRQPQSTYNHTYQMAFGPGPEGPELLNCSVPNDEYLSTSNPKYGCVWIDEDDGTELCWRTNVCRTAICIVPETPTPTPTSIPPTCNITAGDTTINYNTATTISWNSTNATSCSITSPGWTGTGGSQSTGNLTATKTYTCTCSGAGGSGTDTVTVTVTSPPSVPAGTCGSFNTTTATTPVTWTWGSGTGLQVWDSTGKWWANIGGITSPYTVTKDNNNLGSTSGIPPGRLVSARTTYDFTTFSATGTKTCDLPTNQTAIISGVLRQKSGTGCYQADASNNFNVTNLTGSTGDSCVTIKTPCTFSLNQQHAVSYSCTVTWDNQACVAQGRQPNTTQTLTLTSGATGYSSGQFTNASCTPINPPPNDKKVTVVAEVNSTADIAFTFSGSNWIKLKNSSYNGVSITGITVPAFVTSYDADDNGSKYFAIGNAGSI